MAKTNKKRNVKVEAVGQAHIHASFNNIIISLTNKAGQVISWSSAGSVGFKGARKGTPFAAQTAAEAASASAMEKGLRKVEVLIRGQGSGRETSVRALEVLGLDIVSVKDITPIPHNGCRPPKRRRV